VVGSIAWMLTARVAASVALARRLERISLISLAGAKSPDLRKPYSVLMFFVGRWV
jgi:hypothetical protein